MTIHDQQEQTNTEPKEIVIPCTIIHPMDINKVKNTKLLRCLLDTGASHTVINQSAIPRGATPITTTTINAQTTSGQLTTNQIVNLHNSTLPEFTKSIKIQTIQAYVFNQPCRYDIILGRDTLQQLGIDVKYSNQTIEWKEQTVTMKPYSFWNDPYNVYYTLANEDAIEEHYAQQIKHAKYNKADIDEVTKQLTYLTQQQQNELNTTLKSFPILFNGQLGKYTKNKVHLFLKPNAQPYHGKAYAVAQLHQQVFKDELLRLVSIDVMQRTGASYWAAPTFIIPKKDGRVRWVSDFRKLNEQLQRQIYPLPRIMDVLRRRKGYKYFTKLDLSMQYFTFELDEESSNLCTIVTPFGKFKYNRLPMGVCQSSDIAQETMENIFSDLLQDSVEIYIDDIGIFSNTWDEHLTTIHTVLQRLQENGFSINPLKCEWAVKETDWLGYWLTPEGLKPWTKKIKPILAMKPPENATQLRSFIGAVTYYRDMWPHRAHTLAPLTQLTSSKSIKEQWSPQHQEAFDAMKAIIAKDALIAYPDHNLPFYIHTDASDYQIGAMIIQNKYPVAYYSRKMSPAERNYTTMEKELLSIVATLKEYRNMLYGAEVHIHTDHKNLTHHKFNSQRVIRWRLFLEDFAPHMHYIRGQDNLVPDAISRMPYDEEIHTYESPNDNYNQPEHFSFEIDEPKTAEIFVHQPVPQQQIQYPLDFPTIQRNQFNDFPLQQARQIQPNIYPIKQIHNTLIIGYQPTPNEPFRTVIPDIMLQQFIQWYHYILSHPGINNLYHTININFYHPKLRQECYNFVSSCDYCQRYKTSTINYGHLPPRQVTMNPWHNIATDLIGPWTISIQNQQYQFQAITIIDTDTNLTEASIIDNRSSQHIAHHFENLWLTRYPSPIRCIHDNGNEFTGYPFQIMLQAHHIQDVPTTIKNPQSNAICERIHQTMGNMLRILIYQQPPANQQEATILCQTALNRILFPFETPFTPHYKPHQEQ